MEKTLFKALIKGGIALFTLGVATLLGKKATEDAKEYNNKKNSNG